MVSKLENLKNWKKRQGPVVLVVLDGVGIAPPGEGNAVYKANPTFLLSKIEEAKVNKMYAELKAHGPSVGLPSEDDMGNSEVGHNALGSGQVFAQGAKLVNLSLQDGSFFKTDSWNKLVVETGKSGATVHFIGLLSDGNVHSNVSQLFQMLSAAAAAGVKKIRVHPLLDGRDVSPDSGVQYVTQLTEHFKKLAETGVDIKIASGGGRMHMTMDRYGSDWPMVRRGWNAHVHGVVETSDISGSYKGYYQDVLAALKDAAATYPAKKDQFHPAFVIVDAKGEPVGKIKDGDAVINFNFRGDRAIQISEAFEKKNFTHFDRGVVPNVIYAGLLEYDAEAHIPSKFLVPPPSIKGVSGEYLCELGLKSYAISETHKFGHVTYFWNGNKSGFINKDLETFEEVTSDPNDMVESRPAMKAKEITAKLVAALDSKKYDFLRINYPNGDMVGHTGNFQACVESIKTVDEVLKTVAEKVASLGGVLIVTADHGNSEEKIDKKGKVMTSHTLNPVPFFVIDAGAKGQYEISVEGIKTPGIANITASFINLLGFEAPANYEKSLVRLL